MPLSLCLALSLGLGFGVLEFTKPLNPKLGFRVLGFRVSLSLSFALWLSRHVRIPGSLQSRCFGPGARKPESEKLAVYEDH